MIEAPLHVRRLREHGPRDGDERQEHDEQDHRVHGDSARPIVQFDLTEGRVSAGLASAPMPGRTIRSELAEKVGRTLENPTLRRQIGAVAAVGWRKSSAWRYSVPILLDAYATLFGDRVVRRAKELDAESLHPSKPQEQPSETQEGPEDRRKCGCVRSFKAVGHGRKRAG